MANFRYQDQKTGQLSQALQKKMTEAELFSFVPYDPKVEDDIGYSNNSYWAATLRTFAHNRIAVIVLMFVAALLMFTLIEPLLPYPRQVNSIYRDTNGLIESSHAPSAEFWFGTNVIGQDLWSQIWAGTRTSLLIGFSVALAEVVIGTLIGILWGYVRRLDFLLTELYNMFDNIPQTLVIVMIAYILRPGVATMIFAMCLTSWLNTARLVRNQVLILRDRNYNLASRCLGSSTWRIIRKNLFPYLVSILTLRITLAIPAAIGSEVFITYIGLGVPLETPSLGNLIDSGRRLMMEPTLSYQLFFPVAVLATMTIGFYIIGSAFADAADPKNHLK